MKPNEIESNAEAGNKTEQKRRKYRLRGVEGEITRLTISLTKTEKVYFEEEASRRNVSTSRLVSDAATKNLCATELAPKIDLSISDLRLMISLVETVGVPLSLIQLFSLLQKHKSKQITCDEK